MKNVKKLFASAICTALAVSVVGVSAAPAWKFIAYDISDGAVEANKYGKVYYEVDEKGQPTGINKLEGYANKVEWKAEGYERLYPHKEYDRLFLDDIFQQRTALTGALAPWEKEYRAEMWEIKRPYKVYERLFTNLPGKGYTANYKAADGFENDIFKFRGKTANVKSDFKFFGFDGFQFVRGTDGSVVIKDVLNDYLDLGFDKSNLTYLDNNAATIATQYPYNEGLSDGVTKTPTWKEFQLDDTNFYVSTDLTGPAYNAAANSVVEFGDVKNTYDQWVKSGRNSAWFDEVISKEQVVTARWVPGGFELAEPYKIYEFLQVVYRNNGDEFVVTLDGRKTNGRDLPYIVRYTGANANPNVKWEEAFPDAQAPHAMYAEKFIEVNGQWVSTGNNVNVPRNEAYRFMGEYAKELPRIDTQGLVNSDTKLFVRLQAPTSGKIYTITVDGGLNYRWYKDGVQIGISNSTTFLNGEMSGFMSTPASRPVPYVDIKAN